MVLFYQLLDRSTEDPNQICGFFFLLSILSIFLYKSKALLSGATIGLLYFLNDLTRHHSAINFIIPNDIPIVLV